MNGTTVINGIHKLSTDDAKALAVFGIEIPVMMTADQLKTLLVQIEARVPVVFKDDELAQRVAADHLAEIRFDHGLGR